MSGTVVLLKGLKKSYNGKEILNIDELSLVQGEVLALTGPNGAGKSSLLRIIGLLEKSDGTHVFNVFGAKVPTSQKVLRRRIACVFQEPFLFKGTVYGNLAMGLRWRGLPENEINKRLEPICDLLDIRETEKSAQRLSRGQAQRLALARALALDPELLLLDEPLTALDDDARGRMLKELRPLLNAGGRATIYVTHFKHEAKMIADRMVVLRDGRIANL